MSVSFDRFQAPQARDEFYPCEECHRLCHYTALSERPGFENFCQPCADARAGDGDGDGDGDEDTNNDRRKDNDMIQRQTAVRFYVGDQEFTTLRDAQIAELGLLLSDGPETLTIENILNQAAKVVDILTTTESSLSKARKINGGRKLRKAKALPVVPTTGNPGTDTSKV